MNSLQINNLGPHPDFPRSHVKFDAGLGIFRTFPYPSEEALALFYEKEYREVREEKPDENYLRFMRHRAKEQSRFILEASSRSSFQSVIDIGCGCGELLNVLQPHAVRLHGFETDAVMAAHAKAHRLSPSIEIHNVHYSPGKHLIQSDLITLSHVLEHIPEPVKFLKNLREDTLLPKCLLFIEVPNDPLYWLKLQLDRKQKGLGHVNYFTPDSLCNTLTAAGFKTLDIRLCGITLQQHIRRLQRGRFGRLASRIVGQLSSSKGKLPCYTLRAPGEDGIYLQALAVIDQ